MKSKGIVYMKHRYPAGDVRKLNIIIVSCIVVVLLAAIASVAVQKLPSQNPQPEQNDTGVLITGDDFPSDSPSPSDVSATDVSGTQDTTTTTTASTTTATEAPASNSAYDVTIKDSASVRQTLTQIMSAADLSLLDSIFASGNNIASASSSESTYDVNGQLCIVDAEMQAVKYEYHIPGAGEQVILICSADGRVYVGLVSGYEMRYYTNDPARTTNAPGCISGYASALSLELKNMSA